MQPQYFHFKWDLCVLKHLWLRGFLELNPGFYEGMLWKKGKENTQFLKRKFVLSEREFTLTYYNKENVSSLQLWHSWTALCNITQQCFFLTLKCFNTTRCRVDMKGIVRVFWSGVLIHSQCITWFVTGLPFHQTSFSIRKLPLKKPNICSLLINQTSLVKSVILIRRPEELPVYRCFDLFVCLCYCVTFVNQN